MTLDIVTRIDKSITFDRETKDYLVEVDGMFLGYARTYHEGEVMANDWAYDAMERGAISDDPQDYDQEQEMVQHEQVSDYSEPIARYDDVYGDEACEDSYDDSERYVFWQEATIEAPALRISDHQRAFIARQLGILPSVEVVIHALHKLADEATRAAEQRAYRKAATFAADGTYPLRDDDGWQVVGSTGTVYRVANERCDCTAGNNSRECWHESLVYGLNVAMNGGVR